jgi:hypothetical protein
LKLVPDIEAAIIVPVNHCVRGQQQSKCKNRVEIKAIRGDPADVCMLDSIFASKLVRAVGGQSSNVMIKEVTVADYSNEEAPAW